MWKNADPTSHWKSSYKEIVRTVEEGERNPSSRPNWSINRSAYSSGRGLYKTEFSEAIGTHGQKPRDKLNYDAEKQSNKEDELTVGTTKVTSHIPGYNGFIP
jgi:hypothetical protein